MKNKLIGATTALMLLATPVLATSQNNQSTQGSSSDNPTMGERVDRGISATEKAMSDAAQKVRDFMSDRDSRGAYGMVSYTMKSSVDGIIGQSVYDTRNNKVSEVEDILIDPSGTASKIILSNGGFLGVGNKLVSVDFSRVYIRNGNNDVIMPISEEIIKNMAPFTYDTDEAKDGAQTMPQGYMSAKAMLDGNLFDSRGTEVGAIDNVLLSNGRASHVIVNYDTTLGMGGNKIAIAYEPLQKMARDDKVDFKLSEQLSTRFETTARTPQ